MKSNIALKKFRMLLVVFLLLSSILIGCKKYVEVQAPYSSINASNVFASDATSAAVLTAIYASMSTSDLGWSNSFYNMFSFPSLSADELTLYATGNSGFAVYYENNLQANNAPNYWLSMYSIIYEINAAIDGLNNSNSITPAVKQQLLGEAKFMRAYTYFHLVNLYGSVPLTTSVDYKANAVLARTQTTSVYSQIVSDLVSAESLLSTDFKDASLVTSTPDRLRPTKWAAAAVLARVYLYTGQFDKAVQEADKVIDNSSLFQLTSLNETFLKNNTEAIWQLQNVKGTNYNTGEANIFILGNNGPDNDYQLVYLSNSLLGAFEPGDQRRSQWIGSVIVGNYTYYFPYKYKIGSSNSSASNIIEQHVELRLAEQYLIRAEAKARSNDLSGAQLDLNVIRKRAGLTNTTATTQAALLTAILHERQVELFTEGGHRWFDLKRWGGTTLNDVMTQAEQYKGGTWSNNAALYPIPQSELLADPNLKQNPGY